MHTTPSKNLETKNFSAQFEDQNSQIESLVLTLSKPTSVK
jgi:hypothetical protein